MKVAPDFKLHLALLSSTARQKALLAIPPGVRKFTRASIREPKAVIFYTGFKKLLGGYVALVDLLHPSRDSFPTPPLFRFTGR